MTNDRRPVKCTHAETGGWRYERQFIAGHVFVTRVPIIDKRYDTDEQATLTHGVVR